MRRVTLAGAAIIGALLLAIPSAFAKTDLVAADPGITATSIMIGGTFPLTGNASSYAPIPAGMKAYFSYINARRGPDKKRGVGGRQIVWKYYDDGYNPVNSVQLQRRLVEQDKVFAIVGTLGTEVNQAVRPYLNAQKVPHVLVSTGASEFGKVDKNYPWTIGWQPDYIAEARLYGLDIKKNHPNAKIAILYQNDSYGKDYLYGFKSALGKTVADKLVVGKQAFDVLGGATPSSQLARLKASGADTLMIFVMPGPTIQTYGIIRALGWQPAQIYVNSVSATDAFMGDRGQKLERRDGERLDQRRVPEGSGVAGLGERRDDEAVQGDHGEVRPARRTRTTGSTTTASPRRTRSCRRCTRPGRTRPGRG